MKCGLRFRPMNWAIVCAALCFCPFACGQSTTNSKNKSNSSADEYPDLVELDPFGGVSLFAQVNAGLGEKLVDGGTAGGRVAYNFSRHLGLEFGYNFMINNVRLITPIAPGLPSYTFGNQIQYPWLDLVFNLKPRGARVQPYVSAGAGGAVFNPTAKAKSQAKNLDPIFHSGNLNDNLQVAVNYGGGVKFHISEHLGLRFDARGFLSRNPTFGLPNYNNGGIYIPGKQHLNGFQGTIGLVLYLGRPYVPPPPTPPPAAPPPLNPGSITGAEATLCQGRPITLHSSASDPAGHALTYAWKLNGAPSGTNGADFSFTPNNAGDFAIEVTVTDSTNPSRTVTAGPITLHVEEYVAPQITTISATPNTLSCAAQATGTHTANLSAQATGSTCGGNLTYKWTVSEGSVTNDTSPNATFDGSTLNFEGGAQAQTKTVTATLTVTDETGKSVSRTTDITVTCPPQFVRMPDIVFAKGSARVNNCGKRILIDEAAPRLASGDYDIVLVGHRSSDEQPNVAGRGRAKGKVTSHSLDEQRVLNCGAVLSGGTGTCGKIDLSRIKGDWVGTDQTSTPDPGLCGTSNRPAEKERRGSQVSEADKNRRVEVYLVPRNSQVTPPAIKNIKQLPAGDVQALGCPK
jgi:outer membrane protein OmpA-like peptidoglycan-associated protein